jgi:amino acid transporter
MTPKTIRFRLSNISGWLTLLAFVWLLGLLGMGWLVKSFLILVALLLLTPVFVFFGFRWWLKSNLIQSSCPVCHYEFTGLNQTQLQCPSCGEPLKAERGHFNRLTPPGTIDVQAVEVSARPVND